MFWRNPCLSVSNFYILWNLSSISQIGSTHFLRRWRGDWNIHLETNQTSTEKELGEVHGRYTCIHLHGLIEQYSFITWLICMFFLDGLWWILHCVYECTYKISYMPIHLLTLWLLWSCMYNCVCFPKCVWSCTHVLCIWILYSKLQIYMYVLNVFKSHNYSATA